MTVTRHVDGVKEDCKMSLLKIVGGGVVAIPLSGVIGGFLAALGVVLPSIVTYVIAFAVIAAVAGSS